MKPFTIAAVAGLAFATSSVAQSGPVAQQSSDQIICQLSGDCAKATEATRDKPDSRGFSIARPTARPAPTATTVPLPSRTGTAPAARVRTQTAQPSSGARFTVPRPAGRADLMMTFQTGSAELTEQAKANAQQFILALSAPQLAGMKFAIEGHTDSVGTRANNLDLSQRRAQSVVDYLASKGVNRSRFDVRGYGFDKPLVPGNPRAGANRRVEVVKVN
jgi:OmpA-OmpF porin, OOP family